MKEETILVKERKLSKILINIFTLKKIVSKINTLGISSLSTQKIVIIILKKVHWLMILPQITQEVLQSQ